MTYEFEIRDLRERKTLCARATCAHDQIGPTIGILYGKITPVMKEYGLEMDGPPFCRYMDWRDTDCDIEAGCWIQGDGPKEGEVHEGGTPGGRAVFTRHVGPYDALKGAHDGCTSYIAANGLKMSCAPFEVYVTDPGMEPDSSKWITDLYYPVA
ncbi:MAG TPA: GyrI-like domain-containing protein [Fimbriimonadaceae bacterium]|nr:GyrI-like domain-containing protein [Fimbriimonadaceae bacterium]